jgi:hypothetical protein
MVFLLPVVLARAEMAFKNRYGVRGRKVPLVGDFRAGKRFQVKEVGGSAIFRFTLLETR